VETHSAPNSHTQCVAILCVASLAVIGTSHHLSVTHAEGESVLAGSVGVIWVETVERSHQLDGDT
jgi:hypothetical protein